jgi:hypothetical protein
MDIDETSLQACKALCLLPREANLSLVYSGHNSRPNTFQALPSNVGSKPCLLLLKDAEESTRFAAFWCGKSVRILTDIINLLLRFAHGIGNCVLHVYLFVLRIQTNSHRKSCNNADKFLQEELQKCRQILTGRAANMLQQELM